MSRNSLHIEPDFVPEVVIDSEAGAAYVKFAEGRVSKTMNVCEGDVMANIDLDAGGRIVGLKVVGTHEFNLRRLIEVAGLRDFFTEEIIDRARYVRSNTLPKVEPVSAKIPEQSG